MVPPEGTFVDIGTSPAHEDLTDKDVDGQWKMTGNTGEAVFLWVTVTNGWGAVAPLNINPSGNVTLMHAGSLTVNTSGSANVTAGGAATVKTPSATVDAPETTCTGNFAIMGGSLTHNGKNIGSTHEHDGVQPGDGNTGAPV